MQLLSAQGFSFFAESHLWGFTSKKTEKKQASKGHSLDKRTGIQNSTRERKLGETDAGKAGAPMVEQILSKLRKDLGNVIQAYQEVARGLGIMPEETNVSEVNFGKTIPIKFKKK